MRKDVQRVKLLITGSHGQLGNELVAQLKEGRTPLGPLPEAYRGSTVLAVDVEELDITDAAAVEAFIEAQRPDVVINCAAMTNVDGCETAPDTAMHVNAIGPRNLAAAVQKTGGKLLHVSTDYVFDGDGAHASDRSVVPYTEWDVCLPRSIYGKSKWLGERYVRETCARSFVVRTAWLYGYVGGNFVKTIWRNGAKTGTLTVVDDQRGNPTSATDLAYHLLKLALTEEYGIYHCTGNGVCSWYDFAVEIIRLAGVECKVTPCSTEEFQRIAKRPAWRPAYSALDNAMLRCTVGDDMRDWKEALAEYVSKLKERGGPQ